MDQKERRGASDFRFSNIHLFKRTDPVANVSGLVKVPDAAHPFIAPGPTDQRGPCPALNTLANHGYLPHNGIVNMDQMIEGTAEGFNMSADVAALLAILAIICDGNPFTGLFTIGGNDTWTSLLGTDWEFAADASATRDDYYFGDDHTMQPVLYVQRKARTANYGGVYTVEALKDHAEARYANSVATNPDFYFLPISAIVGLAAQFFPARFFSNGTCGDGGVPNEASISSIYGAEPQSDGSIKYVPEHFPDNWYRRGTPFGLPEVLEDVVNVLATRDVAFGANAGAVNSFVPLNISVPTDVAGLGCILQNALQANAPSFTAPLTGIGLQNFNSLLSSVFGLLAQFNCPAYDPSTAAAYAALSTHLVPGERK